MSPQILFFSIFFISNTLNRFVECECNIEENVNYTLPKQIPFSYIPFYDSSSHSFGIVDHSIKIGKVDFTSRSYNLQVTSPSYKCSKNEINRNGLCPKKDEDKNGSIEKANLELKVK